MEAFDLDAAGLRADGRDVAVWVEALAVRLEGALPDATRVTRRAKRLLSREKRVTEIDVALGEMLYHLEVDGPAVTAERGKRVRGVQIKREELDLDGWVAALERDLREEAATSAGARDALERLLG